MTETPVKEKLQRRLNLPLLILYGLGVTIGAGIYVLVGATASKAGFYAPVSFILAALVVAFTGFSYSELTTRFPVSAGEAVYVREGFRAPSLSLIVGLLVVASGVVSSSAVSIGAGAYLHQLVPVSADILTAIVIAIVGLVAAWGILESVTIAAIFTLIEIAGLAIVVGYGLWAHPDLLLDLGKIVPPFEAAAWTGIFSAGLLAFFAFVGFEDIANVAEEVKNPTRTMPRGIIWTLIVATFVYFIVVTVVVLAVPMDELIGSSAPLSLVFKDAHFATGGVFNLIAIIATVNGVLIQVIMASRVLYGLSDQGSLPAFLSKVNKTTHTPLVATAVIIGIIFFLAYFVPIASLAETTSSIVLTVFVLVNLALILIKKRMADQPGEHFSVPIWVPFFGFLTSATLLTAGFVTNM